MDANLAKVMGVNTGVSHDANERDKKRQVKAAATKRAPQNPQQRIENDDARKRINLLVTQAATREQAAEKAADHQLGPVNER